MCGSAAEWNDTEGHRSPLNTLGAFCTHCNNFGLSRVFASWPNTLLLQVERKLEGFAIVE